MTIFIAQIKCVSYDENGRCCGGSLFAYLTKNRDESQKFCSEKLQKLVKSDLEPIFQSIDHQSSYEKILSVIKGVEDKYWDCALGPTAADVYQKFHSVCNHFIF